MCVCVCVCGGVVGGVKILASEEANGTGLSADERQK